MTPHHCRASQASSYPESNLGAGAKWIKNITQDRIGHFHGGRWSDFNLSTVLYTHRIDGPEHIKLQVWSAPGQTKPSFDEAMKQRFKSAKKGDSFGPSWTNHWWKVSVIIPAYWQQYERVQFEFDPGCEAMIYSTDGTPLQGITGGGGGNRRVEYIIPRSLVVHGKHEFVIESSCNGMFGTPWNGDMIAPPDMNRYFTLDSADLVVPNQEAWGLLWDFQTLQQIVSSLPGNTPLQNRALVVANEIMNVFDTGEVDRVKTARKLAEEIFGESWEAKGAGIYDEGIPKENAQIWGIGHCHIDTAWLWPYRVTQQKVARSWSTQVDLMERYPEHRFAASSAQQYKWLEKLYPPLFARVKEKVMEGKFHPIGGSWVENDSNMPSGEALVRQLLFGQRFFESRFGKRCETAWLPDSFGLTGALPQLIRGAGMDYFFTQKLSWNNINGFPHTTFNWVGIDGTQVLCHMTPVETYNAQATVEDINKGQTHHKNLESSSTALLVFGNGDGGGGPLAKMLENLRRIRAITNTHRELPPVSMGHSVDRFFSVLESESDQGKTLPNWLGELYLELHRGTFTSHGSIKKGNRHSEILLRDVEHAATLASLYKFQKKGYVYPKQSIDDSWEKVLLNQFHDVLPGSAIGMVYEDAEKLYAEVRKDGGALLEEAMSVLLPGSTALTPETNPKSIPASSKIIAYNTTFFPRSEIIQVPVSGAAFKSQVLQMSSDGKVGYAVMNCGAGAGVGTLVAQEKGLHSKIHPVSVYTNGSDNFVLRNANVQLTISKGRITSLLDVKLGRELIVKGATGGLVIFQDRPSYWDAWDVEFYHLETGKQLEFTNVSVAAQGPFRGSVRAEVKYGKSTIELTISLDAVGASISEKSRSLFHFDAEVDWRQRHEFLKFELPLDIRSHSATYETQFGHVQRATHKNTTWEMAKFEVVGHKFADLSEYGYGVAILSESKYGFSCIGNLLRISLLRSATQPDAEQDQGEHKFSWAVMPHEGHFLDSDVPMAAYLYNSPLQVRYVPSKAEELLSNVAPPFTVEGARNVFLETIKRGEDDDFSPTSSKTNVILRLYEAYGGAAQAKLRVAGHLEVFRAYTTNLLEDEQEELEIVRGEDGSISLKLVFHAFEVKSVKLVMGHGAKMASEAEEQRESWVTLDKLSLD